MKVNLTNRRILFARIVLFASVVIGTALKAREQPHDALIKSIQTVATKTRKEKEEHQEKSQSLFLSL